MQVPPPHPRAPCFNVHEMGDFLAPVDDCLHLSSRCMKWKAMCRPKGATRFVGVPAWHTFPVSVASDPVDPPAPSRHVSYLVQGCALWTADRGPSSSSSHLAPSINLLRIPPHNDPTAFECQEPSTSISGNRRRRARRCSCTTVPGGDRSGSGSRTATTRRVVSTFCRRREGGVGGTKISSPRASFAVVHPALHSVGRVLAVA